MLGWMLLALASVVAAPRTARAFDDDTLVDGVEEVKRAIRDAASQGQLDSLAGHQWTVNYRGDLPSAPNAVVKVQMEPAPAFKVTRQGPRTFTIQLVDTGALLTSLGSLRDLGVRISTEVEVVDPTTGLGTTQCTISVTFKTTGTAAPINLQNIPQQNRKIIFPQDVATLTGINGTDAIFQRKSGASVRIELQLLDPELGHWTSYYSDLATCGVGGQPQQPPPEQPPQQPPPEQPPYQPPQYPPP
jgi:hypothetical protein